MCHIWLWRWRRPCEGAGGWPPADRQQGNGMSDLQRTSKWTVSTSWISSEADSFPEPPERSQPSRHLDFSLMRRWAGNPPKPGSELDNCELINECCFKLQQRKLRQQPSSNLIIFLFNFSWRFFSMNLYYKTINLYL